MCVCVCVCVWGGGAQVQGGCVSVYTHVHARKSTTAQQVKDIVTHEYASIIPFEICEKG